jgi:tRNA(Ile2) C34 agmatinyltransferase TiaS
MMSAFDDDGPVCPACGTEMIADGVDTAGGMEECHRCPRCHLVIVLPGEAPGSTRSHE